jgi:hypothetical protein
MTQWLIQPGTGKVLVVLDAQADFWRALGYRDRPRTKPATALDNAPDAAANAPAKAPAKAPVKKTPAAKKTTQAKGK